MRIWKLTALLLSVLLVAALLPAWAEDAIIPGLGPREAYEEMMEAVRVGDYEVARQYLEHYRMVQRDYQQAQEYNLYLNALLDMENGSFAAAADVFEGLAVLNPAFLDSELLHAYCRGCALQAAGRYQEAAAWFKNAIAYGDAVQRMQECSDQAAQAQQAEAESLYQRGLAQSSVTLLRQAMDSYAAIGDADMAANCQAEIDRINRQSAYNEAQAQYQQALERADVSGLRAAAAAFVALGDFADSADMAAAIEQQIRLLQRQVSLVSAVADGNTVELAWADTAPAQGEQYVITWVATGNRTEQSATTGETQYSLTELAPDTEYTIVISAADSQEHRLTATVKTERAAAFAADFEARRPYAIGVSRTYLRSRSFAQWMNEDTDKVNFLNDDVLPLEDKEASLHRVGYAFYINYALAEALEEPVTVQWLLRTKDAGVYVVEEGEMAVLSTEYEGYSLYTYQGVGGELPGLGQYGEFICPLDEMLDALYQEQGAWPASPCTMELYLNGELAGRGTFSIGR